MISTPTAVAASQYPGYVYNCQRNPACERSYSAPLPGVPYLQTYVDFGVNKPATMEWTLVDACTGDTEQIVPSNYVVGQTPEGTWYGVFKYFNSPTNPVTTFVVHLSAFVDTGSMVLQERTFFTQMLMVEPCDPLMKIKTCQPEQATTTGFDINGLYYGLPVNEDYLGIAEVRFFHIAYVRQGKVREMSNKATFKSSLYRNFRTTVEKLYQIETELVPRWYKDVLLAIYARGAVQINDETTYLVSDLNFEALNDDDLTWKPYAQLKETFRVFFGCDDSECVECCSPIVLDAFTFDAEGGGNSIVIEFDPCEPIPVGGYKVRYRPLGSGDPYRNPPSNFFSSPAQFIDNADPVGTSYEGFIQGDCGGGKLGVSVPWVAEFIGSVPVSSSEAPSSGPSSEPPPVLSGPFRLGHTSEGLCSDINIQSLFWLGPGPALVPGTQLFTNSGLTTPITGWIFISDSVGTEIFNLNTATGVVGVTTGAGC